METEAPFYVDMLTQGDVSMCFRAFRHPHETAIFNVRAVDAEHRPVGRHVVFSHDLQSFLQTPQLRDRLVSHVISGVACLGDTVTSRFWDDYVSRRSMEGALALHCSSGRIGVRFAIEFRVPGPVASRLDWSVQQMQQRQQRVGAGDVTGGSVWYARRGRVVGKLELLKFNDDGLFQEKDCAICLEEYERGGKDLTRMPCSHSFHYQCLAKWLPRTPSCPILDERYSSLLLNL